MKTYVIDRFEGGFAVAEEAGGGMINLNREKLPANAKEGDVVTEQHGIFKIDMHETKLRSERIKDLTKDLFR